MGGKIYLIGAVFFSFAAISTYFFASNQNRLIKSGEPILVEIFEKSPLRTSRNKSEVRFVEDGEIKRTTVPKSYAETIEIGDSIELIYSQEGDIYFYPNYNADSSYYLSSALLLIGLYGWYKVLFKSNGKAS